MPCTPHYTPISLVCWQWLQHDETTLPGGVSTRPWICDCGQEVPEDGLKVLKDAVVKYDLMKRCDRKDIEKDTAKTASSSRVGAPGTKQCATYLRTGKCADRKTCAAAHDPDARKNWVKQENERKAATPGRGTSEPNLLVHRAPRPHTPRRPEMRVGEALLCRRHFLRTLGKPLSLRGPLRLIGPPTL